MLAAIRGDVPTLGWPVLRRGRGRGWRFEIVYAFNGTVEWQWGVDRAIEEIELRFERYLEMFLRMELTL